MERETQKLRGLFDANKFYYWVLGGIGIGIYATLCNPAYAWYPIIASSVLSSIIYINGLGVARCTFLKL